jgi:RNA polymerase sigma factor (sigma-70 family)
VPRIEGRNHRLSGGVHRLEERGPDLDSGQDDAELLARVRRGDRDAYAELVHRHAPVALRTAALLGAGGDAEDVVQEAFVKAHASLDRFRRGAPFRPWLLKIVANETRNLHRASGRRSAREQRSWALTERLLLARPEDPAETALSQERRDALVRGLARLSPPHRQVVTCRYLLDLDEAESAAVLGWPRGTVKSRLHRALARLRDVLDDDAERTQTREEAHDG